jgi:hypothetical protein
MSIMPQYKLSHQTRNVIAGDKLLNMRDIIKLKIKED